jgi:hypothetical protein
MVEKKKGKSGPSKKQKKETTIKQPNAIKQRKEKKRYIYVQFYVTSTNRLSSSLFINCRLPEQMLKEIWSSNIYETLSLQKRSTAQPEHNDISWKNMTENTVTGFPIWCPQWFDSSSEPVASEMIIEDEVKTSHVSVRILCFPYACVLH